jgi:hypothetical protein
MSVGKPEVKRPIGRPTRRWENNVKINLMETGLRAELNSSDFG